MGLREKAIHWLGGYTKTEYDTEGNRREQAAWNRFIKSAPQIKVETFNTEKVRSSYHISQYITQQYGQDEMLAFAKREVTMNLAKFLNERGFITFTVNDTTHGKEIMGEVIVARKEKV